MIRIRGYHPGQEKEIPRVSLQLLVDKLVAGKETFLLWAQLVGFEETKKALSFYGSEILQTLHSLAVQNVNLNGGNLLDRQAKFLAVLDWQAKFLADFGDLCLNYNLLTHNGARACLGVCLLDLTRNAGSMIQISDPAIRYSQALGLLIAKIAARLKYSKDYKDLDTNAELEVAKKLKMM